MLSAIKSNWKNALIKENVIIFIYMYLKSEKHQKF